MCGHYGSQTNNRQRVSIASCAARLASCTSLTLCGRLIILNSAVVGPKTAHLAKITLSFEFSVLTLTVLGFNLNSAVKENENGAGG